MKLTFSVVFLYCLNDKQCGIRKNRLFPSMLCMFIFLSVCLIVVFTD